MPASYTLYELNEYIRRVVALNFTEPIWVNCEISQVKEVKGNIYMDLVYHDEKSNDITAQISANIWYKSHLFLKNKLGELLPSLLREGSHVLLKVYVEFNERYGLKLNVEDIDPSFTIGQMEMNRQKILQKLSDEGLIGINAQKKLPIAFSRLAVISSATAAGYIDFENHVRNNQYGYQIQLDLYQAAMQGQNTEREVCKAFEDISEKNGNYDCVIIIRGGGSKLDLAGFDNYNIGAKISKCAIPVITGIGHEIDSTVADIVAFKSLKTPTAVADFVIEHNLGFESKIAESVYYIGKMGNQMLKSNELVLNQLTQMLKMIPNEKIKKLQSDCENILNQIFQSVSTIVSQKKELLKSFDSKIQLLDPMKVLKRGFSIVRQDGNVIKKIAELKSGKEIEIEFYDGRKILK